LMWSWHEGSYLEYIPSSGFVLREPLLSPGLIPDGAVAWECLDW
jgi:hypothetical protein